MAMPWWGILPVVIPQHPGCSVTRGREAVEDDLRGDPQLASLGEQCADHHL